MLADRTEKLYLCFTVMRSQKVCCGKKSSFPLRYTSKSIFNTILPIFKKTQMQGFTVCIRAFIPYIFSDIVFLFF